MRIRDLDRAPSGNFPLQNCVRRLRTMMTDPAVTWNPHQLEAAQRDVTEAEEVLLYEFSPNVTAEDMRETFKLDEIAAGLDDVAGTLDGEDTDLAPINAAVNALRAARKVMSALVVRICFIGWPAEAHWNAGNEQRPRWIPDWRDECRMLDAARHGTEPGPARGGVDTTAWNQITPEYRPGHVGEGALRLNRLHLAYLRWKETGEDRQQTSNDEVRAMRAFIHEAGKVFDPRPGEGPLA